MATVVRKSNELLLTRIFSASREIVWKAWTDPESFMQWWGPKGFTSPVCTIDLRVGGKYLNCMRSPEGRDFWSTGTYREIVPPERLVMTDSFSDEKGNVVPATNYSMSPDFPLEMLIEISLKEYDGRTLLTLRHVGVPEGRMRDMTEAGWNESFDKLAEILSPRAGLTSVTAEPGKQEVVISRLFDAPRELVFQEYTDPKRLPQWWGPKRFTTIVKKMTFRAGGTWRIVQRDHDGNEYAFHGVYHSVLPPSMIVSTFEFEGTPGHVLLDTVTFEDVGGKTRLTEKTVFQSVEGRDEMLKEGMEEGAIESMDRLADLLAKFGYGKKAA